MDATQFPTLETFQWSRPDAPNPRLAAPIAAGDTTITFTNPPLDEDDNVVSNGFLMGIKNSDGYAETVYVAAGTLSADGLTATGVVRGIDLSGLDYTVGNSALASDFDQDSVVYCNVSGVLHSMMIAALKGDIASGGANWQIGRDIDEDITIYAYNSDANLPFWAYDSATNAWVFSNDGVSSTPFGTGAGVTGGDGIDVTAGAISVDLDVTNPGLEIVGGLLGTKINATGGLGSNAGGLALNTAADIAWTGEWQADDFRLNEAVQCLATSTEINQALDGISANVTDTNLNTLTAGAASDADALHTHPDIAEISEWKLGLDPVGTKRWYQSFAPFVAGRGWTGAGGTVTLSDTSATATATSSSYISTDATYFVTPTIGAYIGALAFNSTGLETIIMEWEGLLGSRGWTDSNSLWGFSDDPGNSVNGAYTSTAYDQAGFVMYDSNIYAKTANGAANTLSAAITGYTILNETVRYRIELNIGVNAKFYLNGTLVSTITTTLPNDGAVYFTCGCLEAFSSNSSVSLYLPRAAWLMT